MNGYEKLRQLVTNEKDIRKQVMPKLDFEELELRHILWYCEIKGILFTIWRALIQLGETGKEKTIKINYKLPLSSQDEVCEAIYNYLITL